MYEHVFSTCVLGIVWIKEPVFLSRFGHAWACIEQIYSTVIHGNEVCTNVNISLTGFVAPLRSAISFSFTLLIETSVSQSFTPMQLETNDK